MQDDNKYSYEPESRSKATVRSIAIVSAGSILGIGLIASTAMGIGGASEEVSIINTVQAEEVQPLEENTPEPSQSVETSAKPVQVQSRVQSAVQSEPTVAPSPAPVAPLAPLNAPGFTPQGDDDDDDEHESEDHDEEHDSEDDDHDDDDHEDDEHEDDD